jgi:FkbM family methyltransferase
MFKIHIYRLYLLVKRNFVAYKFGLLFIRASKWKLPKYVLYKFKKYPIYGENSSDTGSKDAFLDIFIDDEYKINKILKLCNLRNVIDVGGHSGFFSMYVKLKCPNAIIHCYEPNPELRYYILQHSNQVGYYYFPEAIGSVDGYVSLELSDKTILTKTKVNDAGHIILTSLGRAIQRFDEEIDLLKLDCEGAEWDIFEDKRSFEKIKILTMEFHLSDDKNLEFLKNTLRNLNFEIKSFKLTGPSWGMLYATNKLYFS